MIGEYPQIEIDSFGHIDVLRDDKIPGGTKSRILSKILPSINEKGVVYPAHPYGYGAESLAITSLLAKKELILVYTPYENYPNVYDMPRPMHRATVYPHVSYFVVEQLNEQSDLYEIAKGYAEQKDFYCFQVGFADQQFFESTVKFIQAIPELRKYNEIWITAGSGLMARALSQALPDTKIFPVSLGMSHCNTGALETIQVEERIEEEASAPPPFRSATFYDAKVWRHLEEKASKGALFWNVAG